MNFTRSIAAAALGCMFLTAPAIADDDSGWYIGASANRLSADQANVNDVSFDKNDTAFGAKFGYMFNNTWGIEGGYLDLGDYKTRGNNRGVNLNLDADGFYVVGVGSMAAADKIDVYGKLGVFVFDSDSDFTDFNESETDAFGALGIEYDFGNWNIFGEYSKVDTDVNKLTINILSVGLKYEFN